jgi:hypothetical protein
MVKLRQDQTMKRLITLALIGLATLTTSAQLGHAPGEGVPAYNAAPPPKGAKLAPIWSGAQLTGPNFGHPAQVKSYKEAAKYSSVLHQLPCYCHCDRNHGHASLRTCFESDHGANCSTCMQEALFAGEQTRKGKTAKQIREAVIRGEHLKIDLRKVTSAN